MERVEASENVGAAGRGRCKTIRFPGISYFRPGRRAPKGRERIARDERSESLENGVRKKSPDKGEWIEIK